MAIDLVGIENVGEFYSHHYLDALLETDLRGVFEKWTQREREKGTKTPDKLLGGLAGRYFVAAAEAAAERDPGQRLRSMSTFHGHLLEALGYPRVPALEPVADDKAVPVLYAGTRDRNPFLWVVEAPMALAEEVSPFDLRPVAEQLPEGEDAAQLPARAWSDILSEDIFRHAHPPRWVLFLAGSEVALLERSKWPQGKFLRFRLGELFGRKQTPALRAVVGLLHRDALNPDEGSCLHDALDDASHKHAFAVSTDLKHGVRRAVELIANEALHYRREVSKEKVFGDEALARDLTRDAMTYLYRLLFLFYVEARGGEAGVTPMRANAYRLGYSLEMLRDLELVPLTSAEARNGYYIHQSLEQLFRLVNRGFPTDLGGVARVAPGASDAGPVLHHDSFTVTGLRSRLFDSERARVMKGVKLRNVVMQEVLQLLSLSEEGNRKKGRGRISYAQLGINQLGAVYEGLLAYTGFFADEDLHEVHAEGEEEGDEIRRYFVPKAALQAYAEDEIAKDAEGRRVVHKKGKYIFRLAGRDRERSASYYTPEVLTQALTKYTLEERVKGLPADELLKLTVCEPAMGSGAFLAEAVNQLAALYLERKSAERAEIIPPEEYQLEIQRVKEYITTRNVYGVDLNPLASELGKASLWLNTVYPDARAPYLDPRIAVGNSLVGARFEVFSEAVFAGEAELGEGRAASRVPERVPLGKRRPAHSVYHFLLPDPGMVPFDKEPMLAELEPEGVERSKAWRRAQLTPLAKKELQTLIRLSDRIDQLSAQHLEDRVAFLADCDDGRTVWGQPKRPPRPPVSEESCEEIAAARMERAGAPGRRLVAVMDYWCALWFWPLEEAEALPSRAEWLADVEAVLEGGAATIDERRMAVVGAVAERLRFHHWEVTFPEVFAARGGFDVILGNPPWIKLQWQEQGVLSDFEPLLAVRKLSAKKVAEGRAEVLERRAALGAYRDEAVATLGLKSYLGAAHNYPALAGIQSNLYKNFLVRGLGLGALEGLVGIVHQKGLYDDPNGGALRADLAVRLRWRLHFFNRMSLFDSVHHEKHYELTISAVRPSAEVGFRQITNLFHPRTITRSLEHDGEGPIPGIKDPEGHWDLRGHRSRLVEVDASTLELFAQLYDPPGTPALEARLPIVHSREMLRVLSKFARASRKLADLGEDYFATVCFDESNAQHDGTIRRETRFPKSVDEWVISGPHFYVGTPFNKTPNAGCRHNQDYSPLDLTEIPDNYLPRTNYLPACSAKEYLERTPHWRGKPVTAYYRHINRKMIAPTGERTLVASIAPVGPGHIDGVLSVAFMRTQDLMRFSALCHSIAGDFAIKSTGRSNCHPNDLQRLPLLGATPVIEALMTSRVLRLNCLSQAYSELWREGSYWLTPGDGFAKEDPRCEATWGHLPKKWTRDCALRTPFERRQALVEIDALVALALGLTADELVNIYQVQFPVLQEYERETFYDQRGHIVFTVNKGLTGVGLKRKEWEPIRDAQAGDKLPAYARSFVPPFDRCDREEDMVQAYEFFEPLLEKKARRAK